MRTIELLNLYLSNFKGARELLIDFNKTTNIYGDNATYKTTIFDAFKWLLFDKDSTDRKDFEIKTLDENGNVIPGLDHAVRGIISIDGHKKTLLKVYKEKWQKKRGSSESVFTGNETLYYINEIPLSQTDYKKSISEFADETIFKLLTDPLYFSQNMKWQDRRNILLQISGDITNDDVIAAVETGNESIYDLKELFAVESNIDNVKKMLANKKKKLNDDIRNIPPRIDECYKSIKEIDAEATKAALKDEYALIENIDRQILSHTKTDPARAEKEAELKSVTTEINNIKYRASKVFEERKAKLQDEILSKKREIERLVAEISSAKTSVAHRLNANEDLKLEIAKCRAQYEEEACKDLAFDNHQFICPTCNRLLETSDIEKKKAALLENFNQQKARVLERNATLGIDIKKQIESNERFILAKNKDIDVAEQTINGLEVNVESLNSEIQNMKLDYGSLCEELQGKSIVLEKELFESPWAETDEDIMKGLVAKKNLAQQEIDVLKSDLQQIEINVSMGTRIGELKNKERELAEQIAALEGQEFMCDKFTRTKVGLLDEKINSKFEYISFKLFDTQINGGIIETCEPLINGVPFMDANNAAKINAGIDIINTLSEHYGISAPIFIDNREAVNNLISTNAQIINLIVTKDQKLKVA